MNIKIHDEYATKPRTIKSIFIRAIEYLGQLQIDGGESKNTLLFKTTVEEPIRKN
jgi:hypothetical protein